jgi:predicted MFS family arabinose efflux permease
MGTAMFAAFAVGAPIGTTLYGAYGFEAIALATTLLPLATLLLAAPVPRVAPTARVRPSQALGQTLLWMAPGFASALLGAVLTGFGYSLVFPGFGVEAIRRAPPHNHGLAVGAYTAFLDLTLGLATPLLGFIGGIAGIGSVFLTSAVVVLASAFVAMQLLPSRSGARFADLCVHAGKI